MHVRRSISKAWKCNAWENKKQGGSRGQQGGSREAAEGAAGRQQGGSREAAGRQQNELSTEVGILLISVSTFDDFGV